jgi:hypothetical protein
VLPGVISAFTALITVVRGAGMAMSFLYANPALIGLGLVAAAVGYIGYQWYQTNQRAQEAAHTLQRMQDQKAEVEAGKRPAYELLLGHHVERLKEWSVRSDREKAAREQEEFLKSQETFFRERSAERTVQRTALEIDLAAGLQKANEAFNKVMAFEEYAGQHEAARKAGEQAFAQALHPSTVKTLWQGTLPADAAGFTRNGMISGAAQKALLDMPGARVAQMEGIAAALAKVREQGGLAAKEEELKRSLRGLPQPTYAAIAELQSQIQLKALDNTGDLERENQRKQLEALYDSKMLLHKIEQNTQYRGRSTLHLPYAGLVPE